MVLVLRTALNVVHLNLCKDTTDFNTNKENGIVFNSILYVIKHIFTNYLKVNELTIIDK